MLKIDPEFKALIPPLLPDEYKQLEDNITADGCRDPLSIWNGILIDGHNRYEICTKHGIGFDVHDVAFEGRESAIEWIIRNQFGRRNLSAFDRTTLALKLEETIAARAKQRQKCGQGGILLPQKSAEAKQEETREQVATIAGVSRDTVAKVKKIKEAVSAGKIDKETEIKLRSGETSINRVVRDLKEQETKQRIEAVKAEAVKNLKQVDNIHLGDFRLIGDMVPDNSVDLIFTDPPYDRAAIKLFDGLGQFANRVLRPGGSLVFYLGQIQLPEAIRILSDHLRYWWCCSCYHSGPTLLRMNEYGIVNGWKPILWFVKETRGDKETFINDVATGTKEKSHHEWQQAESEAAYFIEKLTTPGDFVVDPFCGGGTTPAVCQKLGRKWSAFEIDAGNHARSCERIAGLNQADPMVLAYA